MMSEPNEVVATPNYRDVNYWTQKWQQGLAPFHKDECHFMLVKHLDSLLAGRSSIKVFVPLCGKAVDMNWLASEGHTVVGVDGASPAIEAFFLEQNLEYTKEPIDKIKGDVYKSTDGRIRIYCCNICHFSSDIEGEFDGIWDRGSLVAISPLDRARYTEVIHSLMAPGCRYLLDVKVFDQEKMPAPPHSLTYQDVEELYGNICIIKALDTGDGWEERYRKYLDGETVEEMLYLITLRV